MSDGMVEKQRNGKYRVRFDRGTQIEVTDILTREHAEDIEKALQQAYDLGRDNPKVRWAPDDDD